MKGSGDVLVFLLLRQVFKRSLVAIFLCCVEVVYGYDVWCRVVVGLGIGRARRSFLLSVVYLLSDFQVEHFNRISRVVLHSILHNVDDRILIQTGWNGCGSERY